MTTEQRTSSVDMIGKLVGFDTVSSNSNLQLIDFVDGYLTGLGVPTRRTYDEGNGKANLFATLGPDVPGGVVLSGHTDVVPVEGQAWDSDPFNVVERDGRLYGRGTADMKSFSAIALALAPEILAADLRVPIHLALSYDEEISCEGVLGLIDDLCDNLPRPRLVIIGEPTSMKLVNSHKGCTAFQTDITGKEAHSSQPHMAANAIHAAGELIAFLGKLAEERETGPLDPRFDPPYTTISVGTLNGGTAQNIIPLDASFTWEFRALPSDDPESLVKSYLAFSENQVLPKLRRYAPEASIITTELCGVPGLAPEEDSTAEALVRLLTGLNHCEAVSYCTEGGQFQKAGFSTVVCGPGSIDQAHRPNEFIDLSQVEACEAFLRHLIAWAETAE